MHGQGGLKRDNFQNYFDIIRDPLRRLSGLAGVLFFLREDVQRQKECYPFVLSNNYAKTKNARTSIPDFIRRLGLVVKTGIIFIDPAENPVLPKETKAIFTIDPIIKKMKWNVPVIFVDEIISTVEEVFQKKVLTSKEINLASGIYQSSCGTLTLAQQQGSFSVKTARSEGFVLKEGHKLNGNFSSVFSDSGFAAVLVAAMDQKTLKDSDRYLILHLTDLKNTGMTFENADMDILTKWSSNKGPMLMRNGKIRIVLNRNLTDYILYAVDYCGRRIKELPFKNENGKAVLQLQTDLDGKAVSIYEMVRK